MTVPSSSLPEARSCFWGCSRAKRLQPSQKASTFGTRQSLLERSVCTEYDVWPEVLKQMKSSGAVRLSTFQGSD